MPFRSIVINLYILKKRLTHFVSCHDLLALARFNFRWIEEV
uniref:Uncharacterized protein n=2 Tax=Vibrio TaxID=662 RepID=A0A0H3ZV32_9VIBR|nr:hypothetical protein [Vibrio splendidus]AKN40238.1 hypothetical protein [Vibrio tasmaniensis]